MKDLKECTQVQHKVWCLCPKPKSRAAQLSSCQKVGARPGLPGHIPPPASLVSSVFSVAISQGIIRSIQQATGTDSWKKIMTFTFLKDSWVTDFSWGYNLSTHPSSRERLISCSRLPNWIHTCIFYCFLTFIGTLMHYGRKREHFQLFLSKQCYCAKGCKIYCSIKRARRNTKPDGFFCILAWRQPSRFLVLIRGFIRI